MLTSACEYMRSDNEETVYKINVVLLTDVRYLLATLESCLQPGGLKLCLCHTYELSSSPMHY